LHSLGITLLEIGQVKLLWGKLQVGMEYKPLRFIGDRIEVEFIKQPLFKKKPECPNRIIWNNITHKINEVLGEWQDFSRSGRMARNMSSEHEARAERSGSWGVGRFYFRVRVDTGQIFDIYYDRAPKDADTRSGSWYLFREMEMFGEGGPETGK